MHNGMREPHIQIMRRITSVPSDARISETPIKAIPTSGAVNNCVKPQTNSTILTIANTTPVIPIASDIPKTAKNVPITADRIAPKIGKIIGLKKMNAIIAKTS